MQLLACNLIFGKCKGRRELTALPRGRAERESRGYSIPAKYLQAVLVFNDLQALASQSMKNCVRVLSQVECSELCLKCAWSQMCMD